MSRLLQWFAMSPALVALAAPPAVHAQSAAATSYDSVFAGLMALAPTGRVATVERLVLSRDAGTFTLGPGQLVLLTPVGGRTVGAAYVGDGTFRFEPPAEVERVQLSRTLKTPELEERVKSVVFLFGDTTLGELEAQLAFREAAPLDVQGKIDGALKYVSDKESSSFATPALATFLNGVQNAYFYAHVEGAKNNPLMFQVDPYDAEPIQLLRRMKETREQYAEVVSQFAARADRERGAVPAFDAADLVQVDKYVIDATIERNLHFRATTTLTITGRRDGYSWVPFFLFSRLNLDSATWGEGGTATTFKGKRGSTVWVRFEPALTSGETRALTLHYAGRDRDDLLYERDAWYFIRTSTGWYPRHNVLAPAMFDMTFRLPERLAFASVGQKVSDEAESGTRITRWVTEQPLRNAGFNIGEFESFEIDYPGVPHTTVMMSKRGHANLNTRYLTGAGMEKKVGGDIANSVAFFTEAFGPPLSDRFYATEIPYLHGEAFEGIVHLSFYTFFDETIPPEAAEVFRAHEIAHQWWAIGVDYATYRDRWLSEGLSDFSGLMYLKHVVMQDDQFEKLLREWRLEIRKNADEVGPIALGHRVARSDRREDYNLVVYKKGAWVAQMLRGMMLELETLSDEPFRAMMREFYTTYRGKKASTEDFRRVVEKHMQMDMGWFFDQWIRGTAIPTYDFAHETTPQTDGTFVTKLRVVQKDVPDDFQMILPVFLEFGPDQAARFQVLVKGPHWELELPPLPLEPTKVELAPDELVLATVNNVNW